MKKNTQSEVIPTVPTYIQRGDIEFRQGTQVKKLSPEALEERCRFKWEEYFTYASTSPAEISRTAIPLLQRLKIPTLDDGIAFRKFQEQLITPDHVFLCDMGELGLALGTKQPLKQGSLLPFSGCWQKSLPNEPVPDGDYSLLILPRANNNDIAYSVNPKSAGNLARYIQHMPNSAVAEEQPADKKDLNLSLSYQEIEADEIATANMRLALYTLTKDGQQHLFPVLVLTRDLQAGELFGYPYAGLEYWSANAIRYPALFFKQPRQDRTYVVPTQFWKRSYAVKERAFIPIDIFKILRESNEILYYAQQRIDMPFIDLRQLFIESNALAPEQWGPQPNSQLAQNWQTTLEESFVTDKKGSVKTYWQDPDATTLDGKEKQDIMIVFPDKKTCDSFVATCELSKATLTLEQQAKIKKEELICRYQVESHYSVLLRNQQENSSIYEALRQNYHTLSVYTEWAAQPALQQQKFMEQWQKICGWQAKLTAYWQIKERPVLNAQDQLKSDLNPIDIRITLETEAFQKVAQLLEQATAELELNGQYRRGSDPLVRYDNSTTPKTIILQAVNAYPDYYEALLRHCQKLTMPPASFASRFNWFQYAHQFSSPLQTNREQSFTKK